MGGLDEKGLSKIRKKYKLKNGQPSSDPAILKDHKILLKSESKNGLITHYAYYLLRDADQKTTVIGFGRELPRDPALERPFVNAYIANQIPPFIYTQIEIDSIDFVGRTIQLGSACRWMKPHNIQCPDLGQMNWAIFDSLSTAEAYRDSRYQMNKRRSLTNIVEEEWVTVRFENVETRALRTRMKIRLPKAVVGGSNVLIVYYVTQRIRGKYVTCVLSQYEDDVNVRRHGLAPLLSEVLTLQSPDGTWKEKLVPAAPEPEATPPDTAVDGDKKDLRLLYKLEAGVWVPLGNLGRVIGPSPSFGVWG